MIAHYVRIAAMGVRTVLVGHSKELCRTGTQEERQGKRNKIF